MHYIKNTIFFAVSLEYFFWHANEKLKLIKNKLTFFLRGDLNHFPGFAQAQSVLGQNPEVVGGGRVEHLHGGRSLRRWHGHLGRLHRPRVGDQFVLNQVSSERTVARVGLRPRELQRARLLVADADVLWRLGNFLHDQLNAHLVLTVGVAGVAREHARVQPVRVADAQLGHHALVQQLLARRVARVGHALPAHAPRDFHGVVAERAALQVRLLTLYHLNLLALLQKVRWSCNRSYKTNIHFCVFYL